jgi:hypothetical protein
MEDVLAAYEKPYNPAEPAVCLDERPVSLHADVRAPIPAKPGKPAKQDNEYRRCGTANVFGVVEPKAGRHFTTATADRSLSVDQRRRRKPAGGSAASGEGHRCECKSGRPSEKSEHHRRYPASSSIRRIRPTARAISHLSRSSRNGRVAREQRLRRSPWPGCWPKGPGSFRFPAQPRCPIF